MFFCTFSHALVLTGMIDETDILEPRYFSKSRSYRPDGHALPTLPASVLSYPCFVRPYQVDPGRQ
jgi:hypothetical protein